MAKPEIRWQPGWSAIFGFDIFLSYRRADASTYAEVLAKALTSRGFTCFIDRHETETGVDLYPAIRRALNRSRTLVVIVTPGALTSRWVGREVSTFASRRRPRIIPITVDGTLENTDLTGRDAAALSRFGWLRESRDALERGDPAPAIVDAIAAAFASVRVRTRSRIAVAVALMILTILGTLAWSATREKNRQAALAASRELAARAMQQADPASALTLAVRAMYASSSPEAVDALRAALASQHLRAVFKGHSGRVTGIAFSPDGKWLASASQDMSAIVWNLASRREQWRFRGHSQPLSQVAFSSNSKMLITVSLDGTARSWDVETGRHRQTMRCGPGAVQSVAVHPAESLAAVAANGAACVWNVAHGDILTLWRPALDVRSVVFSKTGRLLAALSGNSTGRVWEMTAKTPREVLTFPLQDLSRYISGSGRADDPVILTFSVDEQYVLAVKRLEVEAFEIRTKRRLNPVQTAGYVSDAVAHPWSTLLIAQTDEFSGEPGFPVLVSEVAVTRRDDNIPRAGQPFTHAKVSAHSQHVFRASFSADGSLFATITNEEPIRIWDSNAGALVAMVPNHSGALVAPAFSPDDRWLATAERDSTVRLWDLGLAFPTRSSRERTFYTALEPSGRYFAALAIGGTNIRIYGPNNSVATARAPDGSDLSFLETLVEPGWLMYSLSANTVVLAEFATGKVRAIVSGYTENPVLIPPAEMDTYHVERDSMGRTPGQPGLAVSPDGATLAVRREPTQVSIWDIATAQHRRDLDVGGYVHWLAFTPDGQHLLTVNGHSAKIWKVNTGELVSAWETEDANPDVRPGVSPDGTRVLIPEQRSAIVRELPSGRTVIELANFDAFVTAEAFSQDSSVVAIGQDSGKIDIWNAATGVHIANWQAHSGRVNALAFSADGRYLATGGKDWTAKIWEAQTGRLLRSVPHSDDVRSVLFRHDGQLLTASPREVLISVCDSCGTEGDLLRRAEQLLAGVQ